MDTVQLEHEKLHVYAISLEFLTLATVLVAGSPADTLTSQTNCDELRCPSA